MRTARVLRRDRTATYHCISRTVGGQFCLGEVEKGVFIGRMRKLAKFLRIQILSHTVLSNHWHIVPRVPAKVQLSHKQLLKALKRFYGLEHPKTLEYERALANSSGADLKVLHQRYLGRMGDLSTFIKELKEGFSKWFNHRHDRFGTLWAERFRSILKPENMWDLMVLSAYIDLNSVRAGLVPDPKDYPYSSYGEAVARAGPAREGLSLILEGRTWQVKFRNYRKLLYEKGASSGDIDPKALMKVLEAEGEISIPQMLRLKARWFTEGTAMGDLEFLSEFSKEFRKSSKGKKPWPMKGADWKGRATLRRLKNPVRIARKEPVDG